MTDREKVIAQLTADMGIAKLTGESLVHITRETVEDAIALLREQEPVDAIRDSEAYGEGDFGVWWYACGNCHGVIDYKDPFCRHCGRKVKWNDSDNNDGCASRLLL